jgi:hypothetical protein
MLRHREKMAIKKDLLHIRLSTLRGSKVHFSHLPHKVVRAIATRKSPLPREGEALSFQKMFRRDLYSGLRRYHVVSNLIKPNHP